MVTKRRLVAVVEYGGENMSIWSRVAIKNMGKMKVKIGLMLFI